MLLHIVNDTIQVMEMETVKYLQILTEEIHSVVVATLNEE